MFTIACWRSPAQTFPLLPLLGFGFEGQRSVYNCPGTSPKSGGVVLCANGENGSRPCLKEVFGSWAATARALTRPTLRGDTTLTNHNASVILPVTRVNM